MTRTVSLALALVLSMSSHAAPAQTAGGEPMRIRYIVKDVPASVAFYKDQLGFQVLGQSGGSFAILSRGGLQLLLSPTVGPGGASRPMPDGRRPEPGGWTRMVIYTSNLQGEVDRLRKAGVHFRNDIVIGLGGNEILLDDPSGNPVELFQPS